MTSKIFKPISRLSATLLLILMSVATSGIAKADRVRNGGNFHELEFTALAYELQDALIEAQRREPLTVPINLAKLKSVIANATVEERTTNLVLRGKPKHAINTPDLVLVEFDVTEWKPARLRRRYEMVMHEIYPLIGIPDPGYHLAIRQIAQLSRLGLLGAKVPSKTVRPELLYKAFETNTREGASYWALENICTQFKEANRDKYFVVYCHYIEKSWLELETLRIVKSESDHWFERITSGGRYSWPEVFKHISRHSRSVIDKSETVTRATYGIKIYGLGHLNQLPWQVLMTSANFGEGFGSRLFDSRSEARDACRNLAYRLDNGSMRYYRAECRTALDIDIGKYHYEIITQNPLANGPIPEEKP